MMCNLRHERDRHQYLAKFPGAEEQGRILSSFGDGTELAGIPQMGSAGARDVALRPILGQSERLSDIGSWLRRVAEHRPAGRSGLLCGRWSISAHGSPLGYGRRRCATAAAIRADDRLRDARARPRARRRVTTRIDLAAAAGSCVVGIPTSRRLGASASVATRWHPARYLPDTVGQNNDTRLGWACPA